MTNAGLADPHMWETSSWEATDSSQQKQVFIDGPFASHDAALRDAESLTPVEYVIAANDWVVQTDLTNKSPDILTTVAKCLEG